MEEEKYDLGDSSGMQIKKGRFGTWFENFWYHYKWHTIAIFFVIIVVTICTVQMCSKEEYDVHIMYAGSYDVRGQDTENDISAYETIQKSLNEAVCDFDENGKVSSSLEALYMLSSKERAELEEKFAEMKENGEGSYELNYPLLNENDRTFRDRITFSDYYIFIISEPLYNTYQRTEQDTPLFSSLREFVNEGTDIRFLDDSAIYLNSTEFGQLPGLCDLPENTLITLRTRDAVASHFNKEENEKNYQNAVTVIKNMINYGS